MFKSASRGTVFSRCWATKKLSHFSTAYIFLLELLFSKLKSDFIQESNRGSRFTAELATHYVTSAKVFVIRITKNQHKRTYSNNLKLHSFATIINTIKMKRN